MSYLMKYDRRVDCDTKDISLTVRSLLVRVGGGYVRGVLGIGETFSYVIYTR